MFIQTSSLQDVRYAKRTSMDGLRKKKPKATALEKEMDKEISKAI